MINNFCINDFLNNYWQQRPLLIRNALPNFKNPLSPDEMAGMACDPDIESRIVIENNGRWSAENGPFEEARFSNLPKKDWTLLVQAADHYLPDVAAILEDFRFIPNWRIDDIMVSYATEGGSVGPHYDNYDVFLIQGAGKREWQLGQLCGKNSALQDNPQMRLLKEFHQTESWVLEAGDILYLPPLYAHWGKGLDDNCMTYSVGFRAPSHSELLADFCDERLSMMDDNQRYSDAGLKSQDNPGEITPAAIDHIQQILLNQLSDKSFLQDWFGRYVTEAKYTHEHDDETQYDLEELKQTLLHSDAVIRDPASRFAYLTKNENTAILFINGESFECSLPFAETLSTHTKYASASLLKILEAPELSALLLHCFNREYLLFDEHTDD
jgi:50S ribosomal protein L16 3-hydroxylase